MKSGMNGKDAFSKDLFSKLDCEKKRVYTQVLRTLKFKRITSFSRRFRILYCQIHITEVGRHFKSGILCPKS
jgi:hypothetical protein